MKSLQTIALLVLVTLFFSVSVLAQAEPKHYSKSGLSFNYTAGWELQDQTNEEAQQLTLARSDSDALIKIFVYGKFLNTPERIAEAKRVLVDPYVKATSKQFEQMGARPVSAPASTDISTAKAEGVKITATLDEPGAAEVYWAVIEQRLVVLTFFGPDKARAKASPTWDSLRGSLKIEPAKPAESKPGQQQKPN